MANLEDFGLGIARAQHIVCVFAVGMYTSAGSVCVTGGCENFRSSVGEMNYSTTSIIV